MANYTLNYHKMFGTKEKEDWLPKTVDFKIIGYK